MNAQLSSTVTDVSALIEQVSHSWISRNRAESQSTDWGQTLAMYGLLQSLQVREDTVVREYLRTWIRFHMNEQLYVHYFCGSWSIGLLYPEVVREFPEVQIQLRAAAESIYDTIVHKALRNGDGILLHNVDLPNIYIDTVYYSAVILQKIGSYLDLDWKDEAVFQVIEHLNVLRDGAKPFYIHCEENLGGKRSEGSWARGNGWVMMTLAELLPSLTDHEAYDSLLETFIELSTALANLQTDRGLWRTIVDDEDAYEETSASAMYLFALQRGRRSGLLPDSFDVVIDRARQGLSEFVDAGGRFIGVSEGTWPGTIDYYKSLSRGEWWWGTGAYLLALSEQMRSTEDRD